LKAVPVCLRPFPSQTLDHRARGPRHGAHHQGHRSRQAAVTGSS